MPDFAPERITVLHDTLTQHGHDESISAAAAIDNLEALILAQHQANFDLWHTEDLARAPQITGEEMVRIKRRIDHLNQQRNDLAEQIDADLLALTPEAPSAPSHRRRSRTRGRDE
jgi:hypothetical protein